jgi:hypothetical protein
MWKLQRGNRTTSEYMPLFPELQAAHVNKNDDDQATMI